jgi:hypothetical protein
MLERSLVQHDTLGIMFQSCAKALDRGEEDTYLEQYYVTLPVKQS